MLVKRSGLKLERKESHAIRRWTEQVEAFAERKLSNENGPRCRLADAQFVIARSHRFGSWNKFTKHLDELSQKSSLVAAVADAICNGDVKTLKRRCEKNRN